MCVFVRSVTLAFNLGLYEGVLFYQPQILGIADTYQAPTRCLALCRFPNLCTKSLTTL